MTTDIEISEKHLDLLRHTLGLNRGRVSHRNYFVAGDSHSDMPDLLALEAQALMVRRENPEWAGGGARFHATEAGKEAAIASLPPEKKRSRYDQYLDSDYGGSFAEWLGIDKPRREYNFYGIGPARHMVRLTSRRATGGFEKTLKDAKASYKAALKRNQIEHQIAKEFVWARNSQN